MTRTSPQIELEEIGGNQFAAQRTARDPPTSAFVDVKRYVIESNLPEIKDGHIQKRRNNMNNKSFVPPPVTLLPGSIVIAYVRDSGRPGQKYNRDQQQRIITDYCKQHGLILRKVYSETVCGKSKERVQFSEMVNMIRTSSADTRPLGLLLWNYSRFSRDATHFIYLFVLQLKGLIVHSLTEEVPGEFDSQILSPIKVIAYLRDNGGSDQKSRDQQHRIITDYCKQHGLVFSKIYSEAASERQ